MESLKFVENSLLLTPDTTIGSLDRSVGCSLSIIAEAETVLFTDPPLTKQVATVEPDLVEISLDCAKTSTPIPSKSRGTRANDAVKSNEKGTVVHKPVKRHK